MSSAFPKLPGFVSDYDPTITSFKRVSATKQDKNKDHKNVDNVLYALPRQHKPQVPDQKSALHPKYQTTNAGTFQWNGGQDFTEQFEPAWVKLDRQVLRFYGYFKEAVVESAFESMKVRSVVITFFLDDNTMSVAEPKITNSGTPQGPFLKRRVVEKQDGSGSQMMPTDIRVGEDLVLYGRHIRVVDCDQYTREFFQNLGQPQGDAETIPQDNFAKVQNAGRYVKKDQEMKNFMECWLGGGKVTNQKQFLENDRKVLKFYADNEDLPYILHYYLSDDTVEVREVHDPNSGRDPFPLLLKRQKLQKNFNLGQPGSNDPSKAEVIKENQFQVGMEINIFSRKFKITGCDQFTQDYYKEKYGRNFPLGTVQVPQFREESNIVIPPYNGFGNEDDSLGYVYRLVPKPAKKNFFKFVDNQKILRYSMKLNTTKPEDLDRRFVLSYYLNDDTISIFEMASKNSGIWEGKFLERGAYKIADKSRAINPEDLEIGQDIIINSFKFSILGCDGFTEKWISENFE